MNIPDIDGSDQKKQFTNFHFFKKGGMGEIYKGNDVFNNSDIALKAIPIENKEQEELLGREIDVSAKLSGDNLVKTLSTGKIEVGSTQYFYIIQSFYENGSLRDILKQNIELETCFSMMKGLLNGIQKIHKLIVHRDLKPENILVNNSNELVITDFGLAKYINEQTKTKSFKGAGTLPYMAPECWLFEENSISMDIYSLGIIFFEIFTGKLPFSGKTETEWRDFHLYEQLPDLSVIRADIPIKIKQIISKMTQKRVKDRYSNIEDVITAFDQAILNHGTEKKEGERLANIGHSSIQQQKATNLKLQQEKDKLKEHKKNINYHIDEVFNDFQSIINDVNSNMEEERINVITIPYRGSLKDRALTASFGSQSISFSFTEYNFIEEYEEQEKDRCYSSQRREYGGMVLQEMPKSIFEEKSIIYLGKIETNFEIPWLEGAFGYNLLLVKEENDIYGKWYISSFSDSGFSRTNRKEFALDFDDFMREFNLSFAMHTLTVKYRELKSQDLSQALEHILRKN